MKSVELYAQVRYAVQIEGVSRREAARHLVARVDGVGALSPTRVAGYAVRTYSGRPRSNIRFRTLLVMATSVACRPSVCERSPPPMTRFQRAIFGFHESAPVIP